MVRANAQGFRCDHDFGAPRPDGVFRVALFGDSYSAGEGPDWGWRIEVRVPGPDAFLIEMFNIEPGGKESIAVRHRAERK